MNSSLKNIVVLLVILTFAFVGYYIFVQNNTSEIDFSNNSDVTDEILAKTSLFIERREILDKVKIDTSIFEDPLFISYRNFTLPVSEQSVGKTNPFLDSSKSSSENNF